MARKRKPYCLPHNAGLASETGSICRRIASLLNSFGSEINSFVVEGRILDDLARFHGTLTDRLAAEGWTWSYCGTNKLRVRPPGHKRPYFKVMPDGTRQYPGAA